MKPIRPVWTSRKFRARMFRVTRGLNSRSGNPSWLVHFDYMPDKPGSQIVGPFITAPDSDCAHGITNHELTGFVDVELNEAGQIIHIQSVYDSSPKEN